VAVKTSEVSCKKSIFWQEHVWSVFRIIKVDRGKKISSPDDSPYEEKASQTVNRGADTLGSKRSRRLSRSKRLKKRSGVVERSAAIERLERFEPAPLLDARCPRPERLTPRWLCTVNNPGYEHDLRTTRRSASQAST
jgi:hypothetical protein